MCSAQNQPTITREEELLLLIEDELGLHELFAHFEHHLEDLLPVFSPGLFVRLLSPPTTLGHEEVVRKGVIRDQGYSPTFREHPLAAI